MVETTSPQTLILKQDGPVGIIQLNRPEVLNALSPQLMQELIQTLVRWEQDSSIRCVVLTGNDKAFAAGADIGEMATASAAQMHQQDPLNCWDTIAGFSKPLIAAVSGFALGGGMEVLLMCDLVIASDTAQLGQPEINIGVIPGAGGTQRLARSIGKVKTMELVLTGRRIKADEALALGLVNAVYPLESYREEALKLAHTIAAKPLEAVKQAKAAILAAYDLPLTEGLKQERTRFYDLFDTADQKEGMRAFLEKRAPNFC